MGPINALSTLWPAGKSGRPYIFIICFAPWLVKEHPRPFRFAAGEIPALSPSVSPRVSHPPPHIPRRAFLRSLSPRPFLRWVRQSFPALPPQVAAAAAASESHFLLYRNGFSFPFRKASWGAQSDDVASSIPSQTRAKIGPSSSPVLNAESFRITIVYLGCSAG